MVNERLKLEVISLDEYRSELVNVCNNIPVWIDPISIKCYQEKEIIRILLDGDVLAYYVIPYYVKDGKNGQRENIDILLIYRHFL